MAERRFVSGVVKEYYGNLIAFTPDREQGFRQTLYFHTTADTSFGVHQWASRCKDKHIALLIENFDPAQPTAGTVVGVANP